MEIKRSGIIVFVFLFIVVACKKDEDPQTGSDPDNSPPEVFLSVSSPSMTIEGDTVRLQATASDEDGQVMHVDFFEGENKLGRDEGVPFIYEWIVTEPGQYSFSAVAYDDDGGWAESMSRSLEVLSGTIPTVFIRKPYNGVPVKEGSYLPIEVDAYDYNGSVEKIEIFVNGSLHGTHYTDYALDTLYNVQLGSLAISAQAWDNEGNVSPADEVLCDVQPNQIPVVEISEGYIPDLLWTGFTIDLDVDVNDPDGQLRKIELYANDMLVASDSGSSYYYGIAWYDILPGSWDMQVKAYDNNGGIGFSNILSFDVEYRLEVPAEVSCLEWGGSPDEAYALVETTTQLLIIDPLVPEITKSITLPHALPQKMKYSDQDHKLYIISMYTGAVTVFDIATETYTDFTFSSTADPHDIDISEENRRIYIAATNGYYIMNMDNGSVLFSETGEECWSVAAMHNQQKLLVSFDSYFEGLKRYSVVDDDPVFEESFNGGSNDCDLMLVTPDDSKILLPCAATSYQVPAHDPMNLQDILGVYDVGAYIRSMNLSKDGSYFYANNHDELKIFNTTTYILQQTYNYFPEIGNNETRLCSNSDNSVLMVFTFDTYYDDDYYIYFVEKEW